jgi:hypothetical protein
MTRLRSCHACSRHVFVTETQCPFCKAELAPASSVPIYNIKAGMSRAQRFTLVAAVASQALIGCSDEPKGSGTQGTGGSAQQGTGGTAQGSGGVAAGSGGSIGVGGKGGAQPVYGAPIDPSTGGRGNAGMSGAGGAVVIYGGPPVLDAGTPDAGDAGDGDDQAKNDGGPNVQPLYGGAIPLYGAAPLPDK